MNDVRLLTGSVALLFAGAIFELLRRRHLREKYAVLWLLTGPVVLFLALLPGAFDAVADALGVVDGANLALFLAVVFLVFVCMHLSWEASCLEEETRSLAEEIALLRGELERSRDA